MNVTRVSFYYSSIRYVVFYRWSSTRKVAGKGGNESVLACKRIKREPRHCDRKHCFTEDIKVVVTKTGLEMGIGYRCDRKRLRCFSSTFHALKCKIFQTLDAAKTMMGCIGLCAYLTRQQVEHSVHCWTFTTHDFFCKFNFEI